MSDGSPAGDAPTRRHARKLVGTRLFLISYAPLWVIFAIRSSDAVVEIVFWVLAGLGLLDAFRIIQAGLRRSVRHVTFEDVSDKSGDAAGHLATYLLPFIGGPPTDIRSSIAYAVYFIVAWSVFVPSTLGLVNPTLYLLGWRVVEATRQGQVTLVVCQDPPVTGSPGAPVASLMGSIGWVHRPTRRPWTWLARPL